MKFIKRAVAGLCLLAVLPTAVADEAALDSEHQKFSYAMGYSIGNQVLQQFSGEQIDIDAAAFARAIRDALDSAEPALTTEEMQAVIMARREQEMSAARELAEKNQAEGEAFLAENGARDGVTTTDSGLQYEVIEAGEGASPTVDDTVVVHYRGTLIDGTEFDSSYARGNPAEFPLNGIVPGWQEALQLMSVGDKWKVFLPAALGYGERGAGSRIGPNAALVFEIELLEIK